MIELLMAILIGVSKPESPRIAPTTPYNALVQQIDPFDELWGDQAENARKVQFCESRNDPNAVNGVHIGLFQISYKIWGKEYGVTQQDLFNPAINSQVAHRIWSRTGNFEEWSCKKVLRY